jgi:hypothetical protein
MDPLTGEPLLDQEARRALEGLLCQAEQGLLSGRFCLVSKAWDVSNGRCEA